MKIFVLVACTTFSLFFQAKSQHGQQLVDSLRLQLRGTTNDTIKAKLYSQLSDLYIDIDQNQALLYADSIMQAAKNMQWKRGTADALLAYGNLYNFNGSPEKAIDYLNEAVHTYKSIYYKRGEGMSLYALGQSYERTSNFPLAIQYYFQALQIHETLPHNNWEVAICLSGISVIYYLQRDFEKSLDYSFKALAKKELVKNKISIANELYNIGDTYSLMGDSENSAKYNFKALALFRELGNKMGQGNVYSSLGKLFKKDYRQSLEYLHRAKEIFFEWNRHSPSLPLTEGQIGQVFVDMTKFGDTLSTDFKKKYRIPTNSKELLDLGETYLQNAIEACREIGDKDTEYIFYGDLAELQALKGDHKNAFLNFKLYHHLRDSLYSQENKNKIATLEGQREVVLRDKQIELNRRELATQRQQQIASMVGLGLLAVIGLLLYRQNRIRKITNANLLKTNYALDEANKTKTKFFAILSHDLRGPIARLINFLHLQKEPGMFTPEQVQHHQQKISTSAEALLDNMEDLLLWSKAQMEQFRPSVKRIKVNELFRHVQDSIGTHPEVSMTFSNPEDLQLTTDENFAKTILQNLTNNAIHALVQTPGGSVQWRASQNEKGILLSITDNGPGIPNDVVENMLNNNTITSTKHGFGSYIIKDLAQAIQCDIKVESQLGTGTTFYLTFPK